VEAQLDIGRNVATQTQHPLENSAADLTEPSRSAPSSIAKSTRASHWMASLVVRHSGNDLRQLVQDLRLVDRFEMRLVIGVDERADRSQRGGRHLEAAVRRDHAVGLSRANSR